MAKGNVYDNVFKTLVNDLPELLLPLINEMFGENYTGDEEIILLSENLPEIEDDEIDMKISDSNILVVGKEKRRYHIECQSTGDKTMIIRMVRYDIRDALRDAFLDTDNNKLTMTLPRSAVIFLRHSDSAPDHMVVEIVAGEKSLEYEMPVLNIRDYSTDDIFEKNLLFLLPFIFFLYENKLAEYNEDEIKIH